jgi:hypothetical protein
MFVFLSGFTGLKDLQINQCVDLPAAGRFADV